jgi:hypothetical protein
VLELTDNEEFLRLHDQPLSQTVTKKTLRALPARCAELEVLRQHGCTKVTDKGVKTLKKGCSKLTEVSVAHCFRLSTKVEIAVSERYDNDNCLHDAWYC